MDRVNPTDNYWEKMNTGDCINQEITDLDHNSILITVFSDTGIQTMM